MMVTRMPCQVRLRQWTKTVYTNLLNSTYFTQIAFTNGLKLEIHVQYVVLKSKQKNKQDLQRHRRIQSTISLGPLGFHNQLSNIGLFCLPCFVTRVILQ